MKYLVAIIAAVMLMSCTRPNPTKRETTKEIMEQDATTDRGITADSRVYLSPILRVDSFKHVVNGFYPVDSLGFEMNRLLKDFCKLDSKSVFGKEPTFWINEISKERNDTVVATVIRDLVNKTTYLRLYSSKNAENYIFDNYSDSSGFTLNKVIKPMPYPSIDTYWDDLVKVDNTLLSLSKSVSSTVIAIINNRRVSEFRAAKTEIELSDGIMYPLDSITNQKRPAYLTEPLIYKNEMETFYFKSKKDYDIRIDSVDVVPANREGNGDIDGFIFRRLKSLPYFDNAKFSEFINRFKFTDILAENDTLVIDVRIHPHADLDIIYYTLEAETATSLKCLRAALLDKEIKKFDIERFRGNERWNAKKSMPGRDTLDSPFEAGMCMILYVNAGKVYRYRLIDNLTIGARKYYEEMAKRTRL